jgi:hypothetical protein
MWELGCRIGLADRAVDRFSFRSMKTLFALASFLLASCAGFQPTTQTRLTGEWRYADDVQSCHYVFDSDGNFHGEVTYHRKIMSKFVGRWSVRGDNLLYVYVGDALGKIPAGTSDQDKLLVVEEDFFIIEAADGSRQSFQQFRSVCLRGWRGPEILKIKLSYKASLML